VTITRIGTTQKYADGWDKAFGGRKKRARPAKSTKASGKRSAPRRSKKTAASK